LSNFSAKYLLINSLQAHEHIRLLLILFIISQWVYQMIIQAHLGINMAQEVMLDWTDQQEGVGKICLFLSNFSAKNLLINSLQAHQHIRLLLILFIISQWVYQMIVQAHLGIIMAQKVMLDWMDQQGVGTICLFFSNFSATNLLINSHQVHQIAAQWVYHMIIQAHFGIIMALLEVMLDWMD
jgi:hypothetical protein